MQFEDSEVSSIKLPPYSIEAERSVIGGLMLDPEAWEKVSELVMADDFYRPEHRAIFAVIARLADDSEPADVVTISERLDKRGELEDIGGVTYLIEVVEGTPSASNIASYAEIVRERSILRRLISTTNDINSRAYQPEGMTAAEVLEDAERQIFQLAEGGDKKGGPRIVADILSKTVDKIDELYHQEGSITGLSTGFTDLDAMTSGLQPSDLIIVAGRPSMGKTTFAMNLVENATMISEIPVVVFSLEMPAEQLMMRMLSSLGRIDQTRMRSGQLVQEDWDKLMSAVKMLKDRKLFIDDTAGISPTEMRSRVRRIAREHGGVAMIMIDYLQLMQIPGYSEGRTNEISEISRSLKAIAKEMECPVIALSQLNRSLEQRPNKRPVNSDLRESGAIEQDADVISFVYRDEVYHEDTPHKGIAEIIIGKQRNGPIGTCRLAFIGKFTRFEDLAPDAYRDFSDE
ncbi:Replicative DNA helicase [Marinomonas gallaica]|uniref:Replicative DNA helicase n=1 Tax=Marinomonas gallaica TaxID=1806667 RepID=A0A1C3JM48_9GAMM|nr:replicative DNA helicase [Marinomonas gallaica]SBT16254.1 Replicative DNA helicase [Marinomonas gallaica]SBT21302.1 Replicative DNA helicase [Marinomonas gallaica]